jgi:predicted HTH transcriptional regulator
MYIEITNRDIIKLAETQSIEFKKSLSLQKEAFEALCGMINCDAATGLVLFGVAPDGVVIGIEPGNLDSAQRKLAQSIQQKFDPTIFPSIEVLDCEGKYLVLLKAQREKSVAYHEYDGRAYIREGTRNRQLSVTEKQRLHKRRTRDQHNGPWMCDKCSSFIGMLNQLVVTNEGVYKTYKCKCGGEFWPAT